MNVIVEWRIRRVGLKYRVNTGKGGREFADSLTNLQEHGGAERLYVRSVTYELNNVADPLLRAQKNCLATQVLARPHRLAKGRSQCQQRRMKPAKFVLTESVSELA